MQTIFAYYNHFVFSSTVRKAIIYWKFSKVKISKKFLGNLIIWFLKLCMYFLMIPSVKVSPHFLSRFLINTTSIFANFKRCLSATKVFWISTPVYFNFWQSAKMTPKIATDWEKKSWTTKHITTFICPMSFPSFQFLKKISKKTLQEERFCI